MSSYDVVIIGGGPGGYVAAIRAAQLKMNVALVESQHLGGICLNWGCIPTKALLRSAEVYHLMQYSEQFGIKAKSVEFDFAAIIKRSRDVAAQLSGGISKLMKKNKVEVFDGRGKLNGKGAVKVEKDGKKIADASIVFINGFGFEGWMERLIASTDYKGKVVVVSDGIGSPLTMSEDDDHGHGHGHAHAHAHDRDRDRDGRRQPRDHGAARDRATPASRAKSARTIRKSTPRTASPTTALPAPESTHRRTPAR